MPGTDHHEYALARVYSSAMLQLAESKGEAESLRDELLDLAGYLDETAQFVEPSGSTGKVLLAFSSVTIVTVAQEGKEL